MRGRRRTDGFTLLEAMLAVTILGIVATTLYGTFSRALRSRALAESHIEVTRSGRSALARISDDLTAAFYSQADGGGRVASAVFTSIPGGTESAPLDALTFSAMAARPSGLQGRSAGQQVITYFFATSSDPMHPDARDLQALDVVDFFATFPPRAPLPDDVQPERLLRRERATLRPDELAAVPATLFLDNVASLAFRFFDGTTWYDAWDSEDRTYPRRLPRAVEIDLALYDATGAVHHFTTAVDLPLAERRGEPSRQVPTTGPTPAPGAGRSGPGAGRAGAGTGGTGRAL